MNTTAKRLFWISFIGTIAAIATHVYLTNHHFEFKYGQGSEGGICNISSTVNCDTTTASEYSEILGVPVSILGGLVNLVFLIFLLCWRFPLVKRETQVALGGSLKVLSLGIFAVSVAMGFISYFMLHTVCPACTTAYALSLLTLVTTWWMVGKGPLFSAFDIKLYPITVAVLAVFAILINKNTLSSYNAEEQTELVSLQFEQWANTPARSVVPVNPLVKNPNPQAKMKLVEFADFLCGHCAMAHPIIKQFLAKHPDVEFSFQAWPLDGECNKAIPHAEGTRCMLARISHCAGKQGAPWKTQSWIFENQRDLLSKDQVTNRLKEKASELGIDYETMMTCQDSEEARESIRGQANLGIELNISGTPSLFINGKKVPPGFNVPLLDKIYRETN